MEEEGTSKEKPQIRTNVGSFSDVFGHLGTSESLSSAETEPGAVLAQTVWSLYLLQLRTQSDLNALFSFSQMSTAKRELWFLT